MQHIDHVVLPITADYTAQAVDVLPSWLLIQDISQVQCLQSNTASDGALLRLGCRVSLAEHATRERYRLVTTRS